jgi:hypothetical protein
MAVDNDNHGRVTAIVAFVRGRWPSKIYCMYAFRNASSSGSAASETAQ